MTQENEFYIQLGSLIKKVRVKRCITQECLADALALSRTSVTNIEGGKQKILVHTLIEIANTLKVEVNELLPSFKKNTDEMQPRLPKGVTQRERDFLHSVIKKVSQG